MRVFVLVANVAGVGGMVSESGGGGRWTHGVIAAAHVGVVGHGHVAGDAAIAEAAGFVVGGGGGGLDTIFVAGKAGAVGVAGGVAVASGRSVAVDAIEFAGFDARAEEPGRVGVVFADVESVGIVV